MPNLPLLPSSPFCGVLMRKPLLLLEVVGNLPDRGTCIATEHYRSRLPFRDSLALAGVDSVRMWRSVRPSSLGRHICLCLRYTEERGVCLGGDVGSVGQTWSAWLTQGIDITAFNAQTHMVVRTWVRCLIWCCVAQDTVKCLSDMRRAAAQSCRFDDDLVFRLNSWI